MNKFFAFILVAAATTARAAGPADAEAIKFFETQVRPVLAANCFECHGEKRKKNDLRLDSRDAILGGGKSGPAIIPGNPQTSLIIKAISQTDPDLSMPPKEKKKLTDEQIAAITKWIAMGAPWPADPSAKPVRRPGVITDEDRAWWAFQPVKQVTPPSVQDAGWSRNPIDQFIFAKLQAEGLKPAPQADRTTLIRRVYFDLIGLPPTPEEIDAFVKDKSPKAFDKLVDRLLSDSRYGERWARHWLDLVRYAESDGYRKDDYRPTAWLYRDYVIRSFNNDKPYNQFVTEQLAGDELNNDDPDATIATGYLHLGVYEYNNRDARGQRDLILNELTDVTADVFIGMSFACARCHNHKFDPILHGDYYRLQAFFAPLLWNEEVVAATAKQKAEYAAKMKVWEEKTADIRAKIAAMEAKHMATAEHNAVKMFPEDVQAMWAKPPAERDGYERQAVYFVARQVAESQQKVEGKLKEPQRTEWAKLQRELAAFDDIKPAPLPTCLGGSDVGTTPAETRIPGDRQKRTFEPGFLTVLGQPDPKIEPIAAINSTGRRLALAKWLTDPKNPLSTRLIVNRIWQYHFGRGIVATASDFGRLGERPSHPELLDWLTTQFLHGGWSIKKMHRLILTSATYQQASLTPMPEVARMKDPENRWLWRFHTQRLSAEQIRDAMLSVTGELETMPGGEPGGPTSNRRSVYTKVIRNSHDPLLEVFDGVDGYFSMPSRNVTTTATQSLLMINGQWPLARAEALAQRLQSMKHKDQAAMIEAAYRLAYGRSPSTAERNAALKFLKSATPVMPPVAAGDDLVTQTMPHRGTQAVLIHNVERTDQFFVPDGPQMPKGDFTVEAFAQLNTLYPSAQVRVIAAQWDGSKTKAGWSLGVTCEKSAYKPRNFIVQLVDDTGHYEVVPSDLRPELNTPYYFAAAVHFGPKDEDRYVTFYMRDLSEPDRPMSTVKVPHHIAGSCHATVPLTLGGRGVASQGWDGLLDEVRLSGVALSKDLLLINSFGREVTGLRAIESTGEAVIGHWRFESDPGLLRDSSPNGLHLTRFGADKGAKTPVKKSVPTDPALIDFCHVLLNSNEFIYVD